jgi:hypothetical protein
VVGDVLGANVTAQLAADSTTAETIKKTATVYGFDNTPNGRLRAGAVDGAPFSQHRDYQWYRDGVAIADADYSCYTLTADDLGKKISVKVVGKATDQYNYAGSEVVSAETGAVLVYGVATLASKNGQDLPIDSQLQVGKTYVAAVNATTIPADVQYTLTDTTTGEVFDPDAGTTDEFTLAARTAGHTISVTATGTGLAELKAGNLTWSTDLAVIN